MRPWLRLACLLLLAAAPVARAQSGNQIVVSGVSGPINDPSAGVAVFVLERSTVEGGAGIAIRIGPEGFVSVAPTGVVIGGRGIQTTAMGALTVFNAGLIEGRTNDAIEHLGTSLVLDNVGVIRSAPATDAVEARLGVVRNWGTIQGGSDGVDLDGGLVINSGTILGAASDGIEFDQAMTGTVVNSGTIQGVRGIQHAGAGGFLDLQNTGTILGTGDFGAGSGIVNGRVFNSGTIEGTDGVRFEGTAASSIFNTGTIRGRTDDGVEMDGGLVTNFGTIQGAVTGIEFQNGAMGVVDNRGLISGGVTGITVDTDGASIVNRGTIESLGLGPAIAAGGPVVLENHGTIRSAGPNSIFLGGGNDRIDLHTGSVIQGDINGGAGQNTMRLFGTGSYDGNIVFTELENHGNWSLGGTVNFGGSVTVVSGRLNVNGALSGGDLIQVFAGATLGGSGTIANGPTEVFPFGRIDPGTSVGTLRTAREIRFRASSALVIELAGRPETISDRLELTAAGEFIRIDPGAILAPVVSRGYLRHGDRYTVLTTAGANGIQGSFSVSRPSAVIGVRTIQTGNTLTLEIDRLPYEEAATTANRRSIGRSLDSVVDVATGDLRDVLNELDKLQTEEFHLALGSLDPEVFDSLREVGLRSYRGVAGAVEDHLYDLDGRGDFDVAGNLSVGRGDLLADGGGRSEDRAGERHRAEGLEAWAGAYGLYAEHDGGADVAEYDAVSTGPRFGLDYRLSDAIAIGIFSGISLSEIRFDRTNDARSEHDAYTVGVHGAFDHRASGIHGHALVYGGVDDYETRRVLRFGTIDRVARGDRDGFHVGGRLGGRWLWRTGGWGLGPIAHADYAHQRQDSFRETGAGSLALAVDEREIDSLQTGLGLVVRYRDEGAGAGDMIWIPELRVQWIREWLDDDRSISAALAGGAGPRISVRGDDPDRDGALLGLGFKVHDGPWFSFGLDYDAVIDEDLVSHTLQGAFRIRF